VDESERRHVAPAGTTLALRVAAAPFGHESALEAIAALIAEQPDAIDLRFGYACALEDLGRIVEAQRAYVDVLSRDPTHFGALTNLGSLLHNAGNRDVARAFYTKAVVSHPEDPMGHLNLGNALVEDGETEAALAHYKEALRLQPGSSNAHFSLSLLYRKLGDEDEALRHHQLAFARPWIRVDPYRGDGPPLRMLVVVAASGGNLVTTMLFDDRILQTYTLVAEGYRDEMPLPDVDLTFNAIGDADRSPEALGIAARVAARSSVPVLNDPQRVLATGRSAVTEQLRRLAGVAAPRTELLPRAAVTPGTLAERGFTFPLLLRSPGFHTGRHFELVPDPGALAATAARLPGDELFAIEYLDVRGADGAFRKYRAIVVGDRLYPLHLAISNHWKVHYFSADMRDRADHRAEEAQYLNGLEEHLGGGAAAALHRIREALGLDYGGIDFGIDTAGRVVVFEANATMAIYYPDDDERYAYRRPAVDRVLEAFRTMLRARVEKQ
jgi:glutathione synthase/RimK-type ligase-like ATP-grasp enzyme/Tfp pilus assembly protein PilF